MKFIDAVNELRAGKVKEFESEFYIMHWNGKQIIFQWKAHNLMPVSQFILDKYLDADWQPVKEEAVLECSLSDFIECEKIKVEYYKDYKGEEIVEDEEDISFVPTDKINWAVKKLKEELKKPLACASSEPYVSIVQGRIEERKHILEILNKIFGPKLSGEGK